MATKRPSGSKMWHEVYSPDLRLAEDELAVTVDRLQWSGDADSQSHSAEAVRELSNALRRFFEIEIDPSRERNDIFRKRMHRTVRNLVIEADLTADQLAHCADRHLRMIRGMTKQSILEIRSLLEYVHADGVEPALDRGIFNAKMKGIVGGKAGRHTPYYLWDVELGDLADRGEQRTLADHEFDAGEKAYVRAVFNKLRRLK